MAYEIRIIDGALDVRAVQCHMRDGVLFDERLIVKPSASNAVTIDCAVHE